MLAQDESRELFKVSVAHIVYAPPGRETLTARVYAFMDEGTVCTTVETRVNAHWDVVVYDTGSAVGHWMGDGEDAPGHEVWVEMDENDRMVAAIFGGVGTPYDRNLAAEPISGEGVAGWEVCLAPLNEQLGHLIVPYVEPPALESL